MDPRTRRRRKAVALAAAAALVGLPVLSADASPTGATATLTGAVTGGVIPPITVVSAADPNAENAWQTGNCPATGRGGNNGFPFSLRWQQDTTGLVDHYEVTMALTFDSGGSLAAATGSNGWQSNDNNNSRPGPAGVTWIPASSQGATAYIPQGMRAFSGLNTSGTELTGAAMHAPETATSTPGIYPFPPGSAATYIIPNVIQRGPTTGGSLPTTQAGPTVGVQWGVSFPITWYTNLVGTITVTAVGAGGWRSEPTTFDWWIGFGGNDNPTDIGCSRTCHITATAATGSTMTTNCTA